MSTITRPITIDANDLWSLTDVDLKVRHIETTSLPYKGTTRTYRVGFYPQRSEAWGDEAFARIVETLTDERMVAMARLLTCPGTPTLDELDTSTIDGHYASRIEFVGVEGHEVTLAVREPYID